MLDRLTDHALAHGIGDTSLRPLAKAIGTSDRMLLYYFADKADLMTALMQNVALRVTARLDAIETGPPRPAEELARELPLLAISDEFWPFMRFWIQVAALAAGGDPICRSVGEAIGRGFMEWIAARIDGDPARRQQEAAMLLQRIDGTILLKSVGLDDLVVIAGGAAGT